MGLTGLLRKHYTWTMGNIFLRKSPNVFKILSLLSDVLKLVIIYNVLDFFIIILKKKDLTRAIFEWNER
jgi:hypothetical protein